MTDRTHYHGDYRHDHEKGHIPHNHDEEEVEFIEEDEESGESLSAVEQIDNSFADSLDQGLAADDDDIQATLTKEFNQVMSAAIRKDVRATAEAIDAGKTARAAMEPGVPPEVGLSAKKKLSDAIRHKAQAQDMVQLAYQVGASLETPLVHQGEETATVEEVPLVEDEGMEAEVVEEQEEETEESKKPRSKKIKEEETEEKVVIRPSRTGKLRIGNRRLGR